MAVRIYGYNEKIDDFRLLNAAKWNKNFSSAGAKKYLSNHLLKSLQDDFLPTYRALKKKNVGYFALPRIIFPYITFLGSLYKGTDSTESAIGFMTDYMGKVAPEYQLRAGIDYIRYRNGLLHTNMPKLFSFGKKTLGWTVSFAKAGCFNRGDYLSGNLIMYPKLFYDDLCKAIKIYIADFDDPQKSNQLLANFKQGFIEMAKIHSANDVRSSTNVKKILRKGLKKYTT